MHFDCSQAQSEEFLQQTADSHVAKLDFGKAEDIRPWLLLAKQEQILSSMSLNAIANVLQV